MKRRVAIARALVGSPSIILYDEPTAGLDPITKRTVLEQVIKLRDIEGVTSAFVTHDLAAASILGTEWVTADPSGKIRWEHRDRSACLLNIKFIMLRDGVILFEGTLEDLKASSDGYIREFTS
jgi:phospholipid/cholesterol/gamma-HCH transport system ATP-binding protein